MSSEPQPANDEDLLDGFFFTEADLKVGRLMKFSLLSSGSQVPKEMSRKMSQNAENQKGRKNKAYNAIKSDLEQREKQRRLISFSVINNSR